MQKQLANAKEAKREKKSGGQADSETVNRLKLEIKNLQGEIEQMREDWLSPSESKQMTEKCKDLQI